MLYALLHLTWPTSPHYLVKRSCSKLLHNAKSCYLQQTVRGRSYDWIESYLDGRGQFVRVGDRTSAPVLCEFCVPQRSVLGPLLYITDLQRHHPVQAC